MADYRFLHSEHIRDIRIAVILNDSKRSKLLQSLRSGSRLVLFRDYNNFHNPDAVRIARTPDHPLAYLPQDDAAAVLPELDSGAFLFAVIKEINIRKKEFTAGVYRHRSMPVDDISSITFQLDDEPEISNPVTVKYTLCLRRRKMLFEEIRKFRDVFHAELNFSPEEWRRTEELIRICNFSAWESDYTEDDTGYGRWTLTVRKGRTSVSRSTGCLVSPEELNIFRSYVDSCLHLRNFRGNGSFRTTPYYS